MSDDFSVRYAPEATEDLREIYSYIAFSLKESDTAAKQINRIRKEVRSLNFMPSRYVIVDWEPWKSMGMHRLPVDNFIVFYTVDLHHNALHFGDAHVDENLEPLVTADNPAGGFIPDDRLHIPELLNGAFQLFIFRITGLEVLAGVVACRQKVCRILFLNQHHTSPHSANFSKPPTERMYLRAVSAISE